MNEKTLIAALDEIAGYILPVKTLEDGSKYVELDTARYLRTLARRALGRTDSNEKK